MQCVAKSKIKSVTLSCATCGKAVKATPKRLKTTKSGKVYCSRSCAITTNNIDVVRNFKNGQSVYRSKALKHYGPKCSVCSYDTVRVLEVHHRDENRENNQIDNLDVLCPTHHTEYQVGIRTYAGVAKR